MANFVTTLLTGLVIAVATSLLTVRLALWRFHSEKWWERKAELYSRLMEALFHMHSYDRQWVEDLQRYMGNPETYSQKEEQKKHLASLRSRYQKAADEVQKIALIGAFIVSDAVADDLMRLSSAREEAGEGFSDDPLEAGKKEINAIEDCITQIREHAKKDLGITRKLTALIKAIAPDPTNT